LDDQWNFLHQVEGMDAKIWQFPKRDLIFLKMEIYSAIGVKNGNLEMDVRQIIAEVCLMLR